MYYFVLLLQNQLIARISILLQCHSFLCKTNSLLGFLLIELELSKSYRRITFVFVQEDLYYPHPLVQDILWATLHKVVEPIFMNWPCKKLREKAVETVMEHIHYEDENTRYICIGPVNKVILERWQASMGTPFNFSLSITSTL